MVTGHIAYPVPFATHFWKQRLKIADFAHCILIVSL